MRSSSLLILLFISLGISAQEADFTGIVYLDQNANGIKDATERGLAGVSVSDQQAVVQTDGSGNFRLRSANEFPYIFISMPSGYTGAYFLPKNAVLEFGIRKEAAQKGLRFIHASDTHMDSLNLPRMRRFREMADSLQVDFVIITGDLVRDALRVPEETARAYYEVYLSEIKKFSMPVYSAVGNHELFGIERDKSLVPASHPLYGKKMFRHYLGPNYYSFNHGGGAFCGDRRGAIPEPPLFWRGGFPAAGLAGPRPGSLAGDHPRGYIQPHPIRFARFLVCGF